MKRIEITVSPFRREGQLTRLVIDGMNVESNENRLTAFVVRKNFYEWLYPYSRGFQKWQGILPELVRELNDDTFVITFHGRERDFQTLREVMAAQQESLARRGMETSAQVSHVLPESPRGMVKNIRAVLDDFIDTVVQRLDGDGYEGLKKLRDRMSVFPTALHDMAGMPEDLDVSLKERGAALNRRGISVVVLDASRLPRDLQDDLQSAMETERDAGDLFILLCLVGDGTDANRTKCSALMEQLDIPLRLCADCAIAADAEGILQAFDRYVSEVYLPSQAVGVVEEMAKAAGQLKSRYEDSYIFQICDQIWDLQESLL